MKLCDSHLHLNQCEIKSSLKFMEKLGEDYFCCTSCLNEDDFSSLEKIISESGTLLKNVLVAVGIHPENAGDCDVEKKLFFLEDCLKKRKMSGTNDIVAVGEIGFDFFNGHLRSIAEKQEEIFEAQIELALRWKLPVVLHVRKAMEKVFDYSSVLKNLPAVIFHSFPGSLKEAEAILGRGVKAWFSFGTPFLKNKKSNLECVKGLPLENLLFETDAPFQSLKKGEETLISDLALVYEKAAKIRNSSVENLSEAVFINFQKAFLRNFIR